MLLNVIDWALDGFALLLSLIIAKRVLDLSYRETAVLVSCTIVYVGHEMWESGLIGGDSHRSFELWIQDVLVSIGF